MDPDFGMNIVECGFVKALKIDGGDVSFALELTTPACPIKDEFERSALEAVSGIDWVEDVKVTMTAQAVQANDARPNGLKSVKHIVAVSSCKGGVGKSTTSVNLAYMLAQMGAKVGIFDADVYGPSLPTMISPEVRVLQMDPETKQITPVEYEGVKGVSFGFAQQGAAAIMRGPMVSGLIEQMLLTTDWGELDYLVVDFPPGTGDIQLTLCQSIGFTCAVIVTTPQNLAFVDVAKGIRMFARMEVPCVAISENMSFFVGDDGKTYFPFGEGSGQRIQDDFGIPWLVRFPIDPRLSEAGDGGVPLVVSDPACKTAAVFQELGACVVREASKLAKVPKNAVRYDEELRALVVRVPSADGDASEEFYLDPATVRRNDTSALSIDEWTGAKISDDADVPDDILPLEIRSVGSYVSMERVYGDYLYALPLSLALTRAHSPALSFARCQVRGGDILGHGFQPNCDVRIAAVLAQAVSVTRQIKKKSRKIRWAQPLRLGTLQQAMKSVRSAKMAGAVLGVTREGFFKKDGGADIESR